MNLGITETSDEDTELSYGVESPGECVEHIPRVGELSENSTKCKPSPVYNEELKYDCEYLKKLKEDKDLLNRQRAYMIASRVLRQYRGIGVQFLSNYAEDVRGIRDGEMLKDNPKIKFNIDYVVDLAVSELENRKNKIERVMKRLSSNIERGRVDSHYKLEYYSEIVLPSLEDKLNHTKSDKFREDTLNYINRGFEMMCTMFNLPTDLTNYTKAWSMFLKKYIVNYDSLNSCVDYRQHMSVDIRYKYILNSVIQCIKISPRYLYKLGDPSRFKANMSVFADIFTNTEAVEFKDFLVKEHKDELAIIYDWLAKVTNGEVYLGNSTETYKDLCGALCKALLLDNRGTDD